MQFKIYILFHTYSNGIPSGTTLTQAFMQRAQLHTHVAFPTIPNLGTFASSVACVSPLQSATIPASTRYVRQISSPTVFYRTKSCALAVLSFAESPRTSSYEASDRAPPASPRLQLPLNWPLRRRCPRAVAPQAPSGVYRPQRRPRARRRCAGHGGWVSESDYPPVWTWGGGGVSSQVMWDGTIGGEMPVHTRQMIHPHKTAVYNGVRGVQMNVGTCDD